MAACLAWVVVFFYSRGISLALLDSESDPEDIQQQKKPKKARRAAKPISLIELAHSNK